MNYVQVPTLQFAALVKVAATLWNQDDVRKLLEESGYKHLYYTDRESKSKREEIEAIVIEKATKLPLPEQIKEKLLCFIRPIGLQIGQWMGFLNKDGHLTVNLPNEFFWTSQGTIDKKKTAEVMIKDESIDIATRYSLACIHCLEDDIPKLWDKIPKGRRKSFHSTDHNYVSPMVKFWTCYIQKDARKMNRMIQEEAGYKMNPYLYAFKNALDGYTVAAEYFLQKLSAWEADLVRTGIEIAYEDLVSDNYAEILCLLLSYLDKEEQIRVFESNPYRVLTTLLEYPLQHFFTETANLMWNLFSLDDYVYVLEGIVYKIKDGFKDFDYQKLLGEFWQKIPIDYKRCVLSERKFYFTIRNLFEIGDADSIRLIFQDLTPEEKKRLFYHDDAQGICKNLLNVDKPRSLLKYFIRECLPSKDEVVGFKEHLENGQIGEFQSKFLHVLDEVIDEFKKRKHEEAEDS